MRKKEKKSYSKEYSFTSEKKRNLNVKMTEFHFFTFKGQAMEDDSPTLKNAGIAVPLVVY